MVNNVSEVQYSELIKHIEKMANHKFKDRIPNDVYDLINELQTYHVELELQNKKIGNTQEKLEKSQNKYNDLYNSLPIGIFMLNKEGLITEVNLKCITLLNTKREIIINTAFVFFLTDNSQMIFSKFLKKALETQIIQNCKLEFIRPYGVHFNACTEIKPLFDTDGKLNQIQVTLLDIYEGKKPESLKNYGELYNRIFKRNHVAVLLIDPKSGKIIDANDAALSFYGYNEEELLQMNINEINILDNKEVLAKMQKAESEKEMHFIFQHRLANGEIKDVNVYSGPVTIGDKKLLYSIIHDISQQKKVEKELVKNKKKYKLLSNAASMLLSSNTPEKIVSAICKEVMNYLNCQVFFNYLLDEKHCLHLNAYAGVPEKTSKSIEWLDLGTSICGCVVRDGCQIVAEDIQEITDEQTELVKSLGLKAYACHPIISKGLTIGTLSFGTKLKSNFNGEELELMQTITDYVATAMERKIREKQKQNLLNQIKQFADELESSNEELLSTTEELHSLNQDLQQQRNELKTNETRFRVLIQNLQLGVALVDENGKFVVVNPKFMQMFGLDNEIDILNINSQNWSLWEVYGEDGKLLHIDEHPVRKAAITGKSVQNQLVRVQNPGTNRLTWMLVSAEPILDINNHINMIICTYYDITERKETELQIKELLNLTRQFTYELEISNEELRITSNELNVANEELHNQGEKLARLNNTLRALSNSNHAMIHARDEAEYLDEVCRIIIKDCGHAMVWIGYAENDKSKTVRPVAQFGFDEGYIENLNVTWANNERGRGPTGTAIRTGKPCGCKDMSTDPNFEAWREDALKRGFASSIVLPLIADPKTLGAISIYAREPDSFLDDEIKLLMELANDLAFGINNLRLRAAKEKAENELRESEERYKLILEAANSGVFLLDIENKIKYLNQRTMQLLGYSAQEMLDVSLTQFIDTKRQKNIHKFMSKWKKGLNGLNEFKFICKDGSSFWTLLASSPITDTKGNYIGVICVITDINARKGVEKAIIEREKITKSILYDMMGMINNLIKEESKKEEPDERTFEYT